MLKRVAIIENGRIVNIIAVDKDSDIGEELTAPVGIHWVKGEDGSFSPPSSPASTIDANLLNEIDSILASYE